MNVKLTIATATVFIAGCAGTGTVDFDESTIAPDSSVIAFSVNTGKLTQYEMPIRPARLHIYYAGESESIRLSKGNSGLQRILLEVPAQSISFMHLELVTGAGLLTDHYVTGNVQFLELTQGEINYLGRITIEDVEFGADVDGAGLEPKAVKLVFSDAFEDDQSVWKEQYDLFQNRVPIQQVVGTWAGEEYLYLERKSWTKNNPIDIWVPSAHGDERVPAMGSSRETNPRN